MVERIDLPGSVPIAACILEGPSLVLRWANERAYSMVERFTDQEITGHPVGEFIPLDLSPDVELALNNCADTGEPSHLVGEIVGPGGVMSLRISIYRIPGGDLLVMAWHPTPHHIAEKDGVVGTVRTTAQSPERP